MLYFESVERIVDCVTKERVLSIDKMSYVIPSDSMCGHALAPSIFECLSLKIRKTNLSILQLIKIEHGASRRCVARAASC